MTTQLAPYIDGIPTVADAAERSFRFPTPDRGQRVHNLATRAIERWDGTQWLATFTEVGVDGIPIVENTAERDLRFPAATVADDQRVFNKETGAQERWDGTQWVTDFTALAYTPAPLEDGIPVVETTAERDALYPTPDLHQRVFNVETGQQERWDGAAWVSDFEPEGDFVLRTATLSGSDAGPATGVHLNFNTSALATGFLISLDDFASAPNSRLQVWKNGSEEKMRLTKEGLLQLTPNSTVSALAITPTWGAFKPTSGSWR